MLGVGGKLLQVGKDVGLDSVLQFVGELVSVGAEDLNAVIAPGIVRGRDDNSGGHAVGTRQISDARA